MGKIKHADIGNELTKGEWEAQATHLIGDSADLDIVRSATYVVAASDAPDHVKAQADVVCDGVADDADIRYAFLTLGYKDVLLSEGNFTFAADLFNGYLVGTFDNWRLRGSGMRVTFIKMADATQKNIIMVAGLGEAEIAGWTISDMTLDGNEANQTDGGTDSNQNGIYVNPKARDFTLCNLEAKNSFYQGVAINSGQWAIIENIYAHNNRDGGIVFTGNKEDDDHWNKYVFARGLYAYNNGQSGAVATPAYSGLYLLSIRKSIIQGIAYDNGQINSDAGNAGVIIQDVRDSILDLVSDYSYSNGIEFRGTTRGNHIKATITRTRLRRPISLHPYGKVTQNHLVLNIRDSAGEAAIFGGGTGRLFTRNTITGIFVNNLAGNNLIELSANAEYNRFHDAIFMDDQGTATTPRGIYESDGNYNIVENCTFSGFTQPPVYLTGANSKARYNQGYVTENSGTATIANTTTSIVVTHGLATTPTRVLLTARLWSLAAKAWITTLTATQFTINVDVDPGAGTAIFDWRAQVGEG